MTKSLDEPNDRVMKIRWSYGTRQAFVTNLDVTKLNWLLDECKNRQIYEIVLELDEDDPQYYFELGFKPKAQMLRLDVRS